MRPQPLAVATRVRKSPIAGKGLFARQRIRRGQYIGQYVGELIGDREASRRYPGNCAVRNWCLLYEISRTAVIDAGVDGNATRYLNHSLNPNAEMVQDRYQIHFYAVKNIQPGTEITIDYFCKCSKCRYQRNRNQL